MKNALPVSIVAFVLLSGCSSSSEPLVLTSEEMSVLQQGVAAQLSVSVEELDLQVMKRVENFVQGSVSVKDEPGSGFVFVGIQQEDGSWDLPAELQGNGLGSCDDYRTYGVPEEIMTGSCTEE